MRENKHMTMRLPKEIGDDLRAWMKKMGVTEIDFARKISNENSMITISQSWVSRIANGRFSRLTEKVREVARYANIRVERAAAHEPEGAKIIKSAVEEVWDGSVAHAALIARLIRVANSLRRE
jgi:transcriptional regulator with XRE-family HTH domain